MPECAWRRKPLETRNMRPAIAFVSLLLLSACSNFYSIAPRSLIKTAGNLSIISSAVVMATDKTLSDHLMSWKTGKNCSTVRVEQGRTYCREDEPNPMPAVFCYPTLGDVMCYAQPDPTREPDARTGMTPDTQKPDPRSGQKNQMVIGVL